MCTVIRQKLVRTKKPDLGWGCADVFPNVTLMESVAGINEGGFYWCYWCQTCSELMEEISADLDPCEGLN